MKRAFFIALAIHLCLLLGASSIYILPPQKREKLFEIEIVDIKRFEPAVEEIRIAPPKKIGEYIPTPVPVKCGAKSIELITVNEIITPGFTMNLLEPSRRVYLPNLAGIAVVVRRPGLLRPKPQIERSYCRRFCESDFYGGGIHHSVCRGFYHKGHRSFSFLRPILHLWGHLVNESSTLD